MVLEHIIEQHSHTPESLIPVLQDIQEEFNFLSEANLKEVAKELGVPLHQVYSVATFYNAFSLKPKGVHVIQVCLGTACHLKRGQGLYEEIHRILNIETGVVTKDGLFSVESVRCLGCCSLAPAIMIGKKTYGNLTRDKLQKIIDGCR